MSDLWDQARDDCLKRCFDVLVDNIVIDDEAKERMRRCCDLCHEAHAIAQSIDKIKSVESKP